MGMIYDRPLNDWTLRELLKLTGSVLEEVARRRKVSELTDWRCMAANSCSVIV